MSVVVHGRLKRGVLTEAKAQLRTLLRRTFPSQKSVVTAAGRNGFVTRVSVTSELADVLEQWTQLQKAAVFTPYQSLAWYATWIRNVASVRRETPLIITAADSDGRLTLVLPLVVRTRLGVRVASFAGGKHSNFNMPVVAGDASFEFAAIDRLLSAVARLRPDIDLFVFDALPLSWRGVANPLVSPRSRAHTAAASALGLVPDSERLFAANVSPHRLRKNRVTDRKLGNHGVTLRRASTPLDIERALSTFLAHKEPWFASRGLTNPFTAPGTMAFLQELAQQADGGMELHCLHGSCDEILAVAGVLTDRRRASLTFVSFDPASPLAKLSLGNKLVRELISDACRRGLETFDFGLGEAAYKDSLGARSEPIVVSLRSMTLKGHLADWIISAARHAKIEIKARRHVLARILALTRILRSMLPLLRTRWR